MQSTANRPIVTLEHIRSMTGTRTYDAIQRERAITDARAAAARRLDAYSSERGAALLRELCGGTLPQWSQVSVTSHATSDADVVSL
jgi:hypothetical protein